MKQNYINSAPWNSRFLGAVAEFCYGLDRGGLEGVQAPVGGELFFDKPWNPKIPWLNNRELEE